MALDKNDGIFLPSIDGVVSGKTSQVDGMNGIMNNLIGNDNYLEDKKLDRGNYVGSGELLRKDDNGIWGGEFGGGLIEDPTVVKEVGKRYIGADGKAYICLVPSNINNLDNYMPCNVVDNLDKIKKISNRRITRIFTNVRSFTLDFTKYEYFVVKGVFGDYQIVEITPDCTVADSGITEISSVGINRDLDTYTGFNISGPGNGVFNLFKNVGRCSGVNIYGVNKIL